MPLVSDSLRNLAATLTIAALIIAGLVVGRDILIPLTIAIFLTFILNPLVSWLTRAGLPTGLSVISVASATVALIAGLAVLVSGEVLTLTSDLTRYRTNVVEKVRAVTSMSKADNALGKASRAVENIGNAIQEEIADAPTGQSAPAPISSNKPDEPASKVVVTRPEESLPLEWLHAVGAPAAQTALTLLFTLFLLFQYKDLRDRVVRVIGTDHMSDTTSAMSEAGGRLSKLFLAQAFLNGGFGLFVAAALWAIGVPSALLWGLLAAVMRFVPYIGSIIAAVPPLLLAAAVDPGWTMFVATLAVFLAGEPIMGHLVEPLVLGKTAGVSPFAMIASASFWTLVWGPIGLVLAAPMTTVLVVLGRYINGLSFFSVLLGDEPALSPEQEFYHRLLADDSVSAAEKLEEGLEKHKSGQLADAVVIPALRLAAYDHRLGRLDGEQLENIASSMEELRTITLEDVENSKDDARDPSVLIIPARGPIDIEAARFVSALIKRDQICDVSEMTSSAGLTALSSARSTVSEIELAKIVILTVGGMDRSQLEFVAKRALRDFPALEIIVADMGLASEFGGPAMSGERIATTRSVADLLLKLGYAPTASNGGDARAVPTAEDVGAGGIGAAA